MEEHVTHEKRPDSSNSSKENGKNGTGYGKILITALLTAILTSITQFFLQNSKLSDEQEFWRKRYEIENIDKVNNIRLLQLDELNKDLLQLEVKAKEIKIKAVITNYSSTMKEIEELTELLVQYHKDLYTCTAKLQMASLYYGGEVDSLIPKLHSALQLNFQNNLLVKQNVIKLPEYELDFETIDTLTKLRMSITQAMVNELFKSYELKYK